MDRETALAIARTYWTVHGRPGEALAVEDAYFVMGPGRLGIYAAPPSAWLVPVESTRPAVGYSRAVLVDPLTGLARYVRYGE